MSSPPQQLDPPAAPAQPPGVRGRLFLWHRRFGRNGRRAVFTVLGFLVVSLVVPAATKQWSDRSDELALKKELVSQVNTVVNNAVAVTDCTARLRTCFPEGRALALMTAGADQEAAAEVDVAYGRALFEARTEWQAGQASITNVMDAYFAGTQASAEWAHHSQAVSAFLRLASSECGTAREDDTKLLQTYLPGTDAQVWTLLQTNIGGDCQQTSAEFEAGYSWLAQDLLAQTPRVTRALIESNADGYSTGTEDFLRDLWPL